MTLRSILVVGSGPGIGSTVALRFAKEGFTTVALVALNPANLSKDRATILVSVPKTTIHTYAVDVSDTTGLKTALAQIASDMGTPEVVVYNASRVAQGRLGEVAEETIVSDLRISTIGLYTVGAWALPLLGSLQAPAKPTLLVTSGGIHDIPHPRYLSLSVSKSAQFNLAGTLAIEGQKTGVHVATVVVNGIVAPGSGLMDPVNIAQSYWDLYRQDKGSWEQSVFLSEGDGFLGPV